MSNFILSVVFREKSHFSAMYDDDDEPEGPKSSFTTYLSEGNVHFNQGEYKKALDSYTQVYSNNLVDFNEILFDQKHLRFSRIS